MNLRSVTIIIPALNEERAVGDVVRSLLAKAPEAEVIVVNDGSTDSTECVAKAAGARVLSHRNQSGYGAALRTGVLAAAREYVVFCDADGQHSADEVLKVIHECDGHDMVIGSRTQESHVPLLRRPGKFIVRAFANYLAGERIPDLNSGLRMLRRDVLLRYLHLMPRGFSFSTTSTFAFMKSHRTIKYVPITVCKRVGSSTVRQWKHGPQTLMLMLRLTVLFEPLRVFLTVSGGLFVLSLVSLILDCRYAGTYKIGQTTVLLSLATLLVFMFGLLCDQVSALRREFHE
jgi:glycosyltransferase involved in cell wall biosynthesis